MMKKYFYSVLAASMLFACSQEEIVDITKGEGQKVTFKVEIPDQTKSRSVTDPCFGDGSKATDLIFAMYEDGYPTRLICKDTETGDPGIEKLEDGTFTVTVPMAKDLKYNLLFLAYNPENCAFNIESDPAQTDLKALTMKTSLQANNDAFDAFVGAETMGINEEAQTTIYLKRPFAQVNAATTAQDLSDAATLMATADKSKMVIKKVPGTYNVLTGEATGEVTITYEANGIPKCATQGQVPVNEPIVVDDTEYYYLSLAYVLAGATPESEQSTHEAIFEFIRERDNKVVSTLTIPNLPIQRNYRTNVIGNLLTKWEDYEIRIDANFGGTPFVAWDGQTEKVTEKNGIYEITNASQLAWIAEQVDGGNSFEGKTVKLMNDIGLYGHNWNPIGDNRTDAAFKGTFDGQGHMISGAHISGDFCWDGSVYGSKEGWGLFSVLDGANVKNLKVDGATFGSYTVITGAIAGYANNTTFEKIEISNTKIAGYNWYTGGVVGWAEGDCTFKNVNLDNTVSVGTLWDSHGQNVGGIAGGVSSDAKITIEDCNIACVLDVINDVTSNYKWYIYRVSGMIIGNTNTTEAVYNTVVTATATNVTCKNVTVTYGDWMNYHYCQGYWNRGWGRVESSDYVDGIDHTQCNHPAGEQHYVCIPFDQLFGGSSNGSGHYPVKGLAEFPGVTVNYPKSYQPVKDKEALKAAINNGGTAVLLSDIDMGTEQLAVNSIVDLNGYTLTTNMTHGGISIKNGGSIKNGTIEHESTVAAIKAFDVEAIENVTIKTTCATTNKTITAIAVQQGGHVGTIKNVNIEGVSQGIEVGYQATVDLIEGVNVEMNTNGTAEGIGLVINGGKVGKATNCTFVGDDYGVKMLLKGVFNVALELSGCTATGTTASIAAYDEKGISNTSGSLTLTYDNATTLNGPFVWDFEDECKSVVTLNKPE